MAKSWLNKNNVSFTEKNVGQAGVIDELMALGYHGSTPVIMVDETVIVGYSPSKLSEVLKIKASF